MGDEYAWLVGLEERKIVTKEVEDEGLLVNAVTNENLSEDMYSELLGLQERVSQAGIQENNLASNGSNLDMISKVEQENTDPKADVFSAGQDKEKLHGSKLTPQSETMGTNAGLSIGDDTKGSTLHSVKHVPSVPVSTSTSASIVNFTPSAYTPSISGNISSENISYEDIEDIKPYVERDAHDGTTLNISENDDEESIASGNASSDSLALMNLSGNDTNASPTTLSENVIQIGDRFYAITAVLFAALKIHLSQTMEGAEVLSRGGFDAVSTHGKTAGRVVGHHLVSGAAMLRELASVRMICAVIRETCHFTLDRTRLFTKWYTTSIISDDPEMVYRKSIRNTSSLSHPDCATTSLTLNSNIVKRRAQFSTISWMDRQLIWETRDETTGDVTRRARKSGPSPKLFKSQVLYDAGNDNSEKRIESNSDDRMLSGIPSFHHCQSIYESPSQAAFNANNAYDPTSKNSKNSKEIARPTATATANYFDLLDALISSAFDHKRGPGSREAYAILVDMITPPAFEEKSSCADCFERFSMTNFRHHCRNCGRSICRSCSSQKNKRIPKYGYTDPVRVCYPCAIKVDAEATMDRVQWRLMRIKDHLNDQLIPFFSHGVDRGIDKANRVVDMGLFMLKSALMCNYPAFLIVETVDILKRYGMAGLAGVLMRNDFVEAAETLKKISGMDKQYPISLSELTACIYYRLAIERGIRGTDPEGEHRLHYPKDVEPDDPPYCSPVSLEALESIIDYSSMALMVVYEANPVECQRIALAQGYSCICAETISKAEKPAFGIYVSNADEASSESSPDQPQTSSRSEKGFDVKMHRSKPKEVILTVRGTLSIHDVVTDIRTAPHPFPPSQEEILSCRAHCGNMYHKFEKALSSQVEAQADGY